MKVVFLDIDGVLNSDDFWRRRSERFHAERTFRDYMFAENIDEPAVARLNQILERSCAKVVICSTWRRKVKRYISGKGFDYDSEEDKMVIIRDLLEAKGFKGEIIGMTPTLWRRPDGVMQWRGDEIQKWMDENPGVTDFVILDDGMDMAHLMHKLVKTENKDGLQDRHVEAALKILGVDTETKTG